MFRSSLLGAFALSLLLSACGPVNINLPAGSVNLTPPSGTTINVPQDPNAPLTNTTPAPPPPPLSQGGGGVDGGFNPNGGVFGQRLVR